MRSAPQFAVTLLIYEMLQRIFYIDFGGPDGQSTLPSGVQPKNTAGDPEKLVRPVQLINRVDVVGGFCLPRFGTK